MTTAPSLLALVGFGALGAAVGSFWTVAAWRTGEDLRAALRGRSRCDSCKAPLRARDLVPIFSWLATRGRCRRCAAAVSFGYPLAEGAAALIGLAALIAIGWPGAILGAVFGWLLLGLAMIDLDRMILPNVLTYPLTAMGLAIASAAALAPDALATPLAHPPAPSAAFLGAACGYGVLELLAWAYRKTRGVDGLGGGDSKLMAAAGAWLGVEPLPLVVASGAAGLIVVATAKGAPARAELAFGPYLCAAIFIAYLIADRAG